jgi:hypothetical protein
MSTTADAVNTAGAGAANTTIFKSLADKVNAVDFDVNNVLLTLEQKYNRHLETRQHTLHLLKQQQTSQQNLLQELNKDMVRPTHICSTLHDAIREGRRSFDYDRDILERLERLYDGFWFTYTKKKNIITEKEKEMGEICEQIRELDKEISVLSSALRSITM